MVPAGVFPDKRATTAHEVAGDSLAARCNQLEGLLIDHSAGKAKVRLEAQNSPGSPDEIGVRDSDPRAGYRRSRDGLLLTRE